MLALKYKYLFVLVYFWEFAIEIPLWWDGVASPSGSHGERFYRRLAFYALCLIGLWHSPQRPGGALMGRWTMALMEGMQTSSNAVMLVTQVLFLMWNKSAHRGCSSHLFAQRKLFWLNRVQINLVQMQKRVSFISRGSLRPSATYVKRATLVCWFRGSFRAVLFYQAEPVFPDWRMMMFVVACVSVLLWQIQFESKRLILCLKACFSLSDWPVCVVSLTVLEKLHIWWAYLRISVSYAVPNYQTVSVTPVDIQAQG